MHLTGSVVSLDSLLFVDLPRIDAAAHTFEKRDLKAVAPTQSDPDSLKKNLQSGEWVLRSYAPKIPMVTYYKKQWVFSPQALEIAPKGLIERAEKRFSLTTIAAIDQADNAVAEKQRAIQTDKEKMIHDLRQMFVFVQIKKQDEIRRDRPTGIYHRDPMAPHSAPFGPPNDYIVDKVLTNIANESMINSYTFPGEAMWHSACTEHYFLEYSFPWYDFKYCFNVQYEFSQWITNYHYKHTSAAYWAIRNAPEPEPEKPSEYALNGSPKIDRWVQVRLIDEDGKALPNKDYKIYPKHNRKSALFSGTTDKDGLSERIILGHAFERVQVVFLEDQDANIAESDSIDWTERVIDVTVKRTFKAGYIVNNRRTTLDALYDEHVSDQLNFKKESMFRKHNSHLVADRILPGEIVIFANIPNTSDDHKALSALQYQAQMASDDIQQLDDDEAQTAYTHTVLLDHLNPDSSEWASAGIGITSAAMGRRMDDLKTILEKLNQNYLDNVKSGPGKPGFTPAFYKTRQTLFKQLDNALERLTMQKINIADDSKIKTALGLSSKSILHNWDTIKDTGEVPQLGKRIGYVASLAKGAKHLGYIGIGIEGLVAADNIKNACIGEDAAECEVVSFKETFGFGGSMAGGYFGGKLAATGAVSLALLVGISAVGAPIVIIAVVAAGAGAYFGSKGVGEFGKRFGEKLYEFKEDPFKP